MAKNTLNFRTCHPSIELSDARLLGIEGRLTALDQKVDRRFDALEPRFRSLDEKIDQKVSDLNQKLDQTGAALDTKIGALDVKVGDLHRKSDARFKWVAGLLVACLSGVLTCTIGLLLVRFKP